MRCATCRTWPPAYDASVAAADYTRPLDRAVTALKFSGQIGLASGLGALLADAWMAGAGELGTGLGNESGTQVPGVGSESGTPVPESVDCIVPIPLSATRLAERGFNQAHLIAVSMVKRLRGLPAPPVMRPSLLARHHDTLAQSLLRWEARQANLDHGFIARQRLDGLRIGVVDDVMTTGATLQAAALALKDAGASRVVNLVVARTA